jgi:hypothetical protein
MTHTRRFLRGSFVILPVLAVTIGLVPAAEAGNAPSSQRPLTAAAARALSTQVRDRVIVVFNDQVSAVPDTAGDRSTRIAAVRAVQRPVLSELKATHATNVRSVSLVNAVAATVSAGEAQRLRANPAVAEVVKDQPIPVGNALPTRPAGVTPDFTSPPTACAAKGHVQLNPQAIETIHAATQSGKGAAAQSRGYTGKGEKVGYIADGIDPNNPDFIRPNGKHVFVDSQDFSGTGTSAPTSGGEAFLDASSIAAQGRKVYNLDNFGTGLTTPCLIRVRGVAPGASLVGLNVFGSSNSAFNSVFLEAIDYAVNVDHVNVLNESFGANPFPDTASLDLTKQADDAAVKAGVTVVVSSGDAGPTNTIGSPASDPKVVSVGASTTYRSYAQTGIGLINAPGVKGWLNNNISGLSSGGFTAAGPTVDLVAPGDLNWALCTPKPQLFGACTDFAGKPASIELSGGTSESAPLTSGVAALVDQAYAKTHHGARPSPAVVKRILVSTADDIGAPAEQQGAGLVNAFRAVRAAASYPGASKPRTGNAVLDSHTQLSATGQPGATQHLAERLTNDGSHATSVKLTSRRLSTYRPVLTKSLSLTAAKGDQAALTFRVPKNQARLSASIALKDVVDLSLISPSGKLAEFNLPQGQGNFGNAQVAHPAAGIWTALIAAAPETSAIPAKFQASTATWRSFGSLSRSSLHLAPGASKGVTLTVATPGTPGDRAGSIVIRSVAGRRSVSTGTVPVTLRSLVPTPAPSSSFTGTLTGGNGRASNTGQSAFYQVHVPSGTKVLNAQISTPNSANTFFAELIDPSTEQAASTAGNGLAVADGKGGTTLRPVTGAQLHVLKPAAGTWTLAIDFFNTVSGTSVAQPISVRLDTTPNAASVSGLPDSSATKLAAGTPTTVGVTVKNTGRAPETYFIDSRGTGSTTQPLAEQSGAVLKLPNLDGALPTYFVPSHTTALAATTVTSKPVLFDLSMFSGDPDLESTTPFTATTARLGFSSPAVSTGDWFLTPFLTGPTGVTGPTPVPATTSVTATMAPFDPTVTAPTGDLWRSSTDAHAGFTPVVVNPGQSATIPVTITPSGAAGTAVTGTLYVDDASMISNLTPDNGAVDAPLPDGSDVAAFPYSYTIK